MVEKMAFLSNNQSTTPTFTKTGFCPFRASLGTSIFQGIFIFL